MEKEFLNKYFEFGGRVQSLDKSKGNYFGAYMFVLPDDFGKIDFGESELEEWRGWTVSLLEAELQKKLVQNAKILYIGKSESVTVQKRVLKHIRLWKGESVAAYGGRIIGQIKNWGNLEVWYLKSGNPSQTRKDLLTTFQKCYGELPFANWKL